MSSSTSDFSVLLNQYLNDRDRTAAWLARQLGVNRATVSRWLNGTTVPRHADAVRDIATALSLPRDQFDALLFALDMDTGSQAAKSAALTPAVNGRDVPAGAAQAGNRRRDVLSPLIGRAEELDVLCTALRDPATRLVTVLGPGGIGKTRLAAEAAWSERALFDVVCTLSFADSTALTAGTGAADQQLLHGVSGALGVPFEDGVPQFEQVTAFLRSRRVLLVLNSFEEILDERAVLARLLAATDQLCVLVTSQESLGLAQERLLPLAGLDCPPRATPAAALADYGAAELFMLRVGQLTPVFTVDEEDAPAVVAICRAVAGFPLGLLLAAGMYVDLPCAEIAAVLQTSPAALQAPSAGIEPRHLQLDAVFASAWARAAPDAQRLLCALTLFHQSFTREDAQQVLGADALQIVVDGHAQDGIFYLLQRSFLRLDRSARRYVMDPPLFRFAAGQRAETVDLATLAAVQARHADHFTSRLHAGANAFTQADAADDARFLADWYDIRAALFWRLTRDGVAAVCDDVNLVCDFFDLRSRHQDVIDFLDEVLARARAHGATPAAQVPAEWLFRKGEAYYKSGQHHESKQTLLAALVQLGEPIDVLRDDRARDPRVLPELLTQIRLRLLPAAVKQPAPNAANLELRARVFTILAQIFFFDDEAVLTEYVILRAANLAERAGAPVELQARGLAALCVGLGLDPKTRPIAAHYAKLTARMSETLATSPDSRERAACAYALVVLTLYELAVGQLASAQRHAALASQINRGLGKYRGYVESATMEIAVDELTGASRRAWPAWREIRTLAEARGDAQIRRWALSGELENRLRLGTELALDLDEVVVPADLAALLATFIDAGRAEGDSSVLLNLYGLLALVSLRHGLDDRLFDDLRRLHVAVTRADFTKITDFFGYSSAAEATVTLLDDVTRGRRTVAAPQRAELTRMAADACRELESYARVFPVARSRSLTWRGLLHSVDGHMNKATRCWEQSVRRAEQLGLRYDLGLAYFAWGRHMPPDAPTRQVQLAQARAVFRALDNAYMVGLIDAELG
ncbi:MAG: helix-turn-helix domain-containing protein [Caldilineaceae bacterium]